MDKSVSEPVTRPGSLSGFCLDLCSLCLTALEIFSYLKLEGSLFNVNFCGTSQTQTGRGGVQRKRCQWGNFTCVRFLLCLVEAAWRSRFWGSVLLGRCPFQACPVAFPNLPLFTTVLCAGNQPPWPPWTGVSSFVSLILCRRGALPVPQVLLPALAALQDPGPQWGFPHLQSLCKRIGVNR